MSCHVGINIPFVPWMVYGAVWGANLLQLLRSDPEPERVDLDAWESRLKTLLRSNNSELLGCWTVVWEWRLVTCFLFSQVLLDVSVFSYSEGHS